MGVETDVILGSDGLLSKGDDMVNILIRRFKYSVTYTFIETLYFISIFVMGIFFT